MIATLVGATIALFGAFWSPMRVIYDWAWRPVLAADAAKARPMNRASVTEERRAA